MLTDKKILKYSDLPKLRERMSRAGKTIVFTSGCYDLLHFGHVMHFNYCKTKGDVLVVSVGNDKTLRDLKGPQRPLVKEKLRIRLIAALEIVDYAVLSREGGIMDHSEMVRLLKPDIYIVPATDKHLAEKQALVDTYGGKLYRCRRLPPQHLKGGISSTQLEEKLAHL